MLKNQENCHNVKIWLNCSVALGGPLRNTTTFFTELSRQTMVHADGSFGWETTGIFEWNGKTEKFQIGW
jgi:hypothetical protein